MGSNRGFTIARCRFGKWQKIMKHAVCFWLLLIAVGCCSTKEREPVATYQIKHPDEAKKFIYLNPVNLNTYRCMLGDQEGWVGSIVTSLRKKFPDVPGVQEFANQQLKEEASETAAEIDKFKDFEKASTNGGAICQFEWDDGKTHEIGLLVLKDGEIVRRDVWLTDYLTESAEEFEKAVRKNIRTNSNVNIPAK
jgi:hypothetical protein